MLHLRFTQNTAILNAIGKRTATVFSTKNEADTMNIF